MSLIPNNLLRPPQIEEISRQFLPREKQREYTITPDGGLFDLKDIGRALRRASPWDRIFLPEGEHAIPEIAKSLYIRGLPQGAVLKGPLKIRSDYLLLAGMEIYAPIGQPAICLERGTLFLEDCNIQGEIRVGPGASLFMRNCVTGRAEEGISAIDGATVEIHTSRLSNCKAGISLRNNASCSLYHCRIEHCRRPDEGDAGAGIYAENSTIHAEGVTLANNHIGLHLKDCPKVSLLSCHLLDQKAAAIIANGRPEDRLTLCASRIEGQESTRCAQVVSTGGTLIVLYSLIENAPAAALTIDQGRLEIVHSRLSSSANSALEALSCDFSVEDLVCECAAAALNATNCKGRIHKGLFTGTPPLQLKESPKLLMEDCQSVGAAMIAPQPVEAAPSTQIEHFLQSLNEVVSHESVRTELKRILRLAHGAQQRRLTGVPIPEQSFHTVFTGTTGTGKLAAARELAAGLYAFGVTSEPGVQELNLGAFKAKENGHGPFPPDNLTGKVFFLSGRQATGFAANLSEIQEAIAKLARIPQAVLILDGDRDEMRRLIRGYPELERAFSRFIHFPSYGPIELTSLFRQRCQQDRIPLSHEAALCCLLLFHVHCDRKDRRFTTVEGVMALYEAARQRYLERCSHQNRFDLDLEKQDLDLPPEKNFRLALERSPAFVSFCPACTKENPWVMGGNEQMVCLHCGVPYTAAWGLWKESATYRRMQDSIGHNLGSGAISRRTHSRLYSSL